MCEADLCTADQVVIFKGDFAFLQAINLTAFTTGDLVFMGGKKFLPVWLSPWQMVVRWNSLLDMDWTQVDLETWEWLRVSLDLVVFWSWLGQGLDPELDNMQKVIRCLFFSKDSSIYSTIKYCPLKETKFSWRTRSLTYTNFVFF